MNDICRLCLNNVLPICNKTVSDCISQEEKIRLLMPEIDITTTPTFTLCSECTQSLNDAYAFKYACIQVENLIREYITHMKTTVLNLEHVRNRKHDIEETVYKEDIKMEVDDFNVSVKQFVEIAAMKNDASLMFICDKCHGHFCGNEKFQKHKDECMPYDSYEDNQSNLMLLRKEQLEKHQSLHMDSKFLCDICSRSYKRIYELRRHISLHHSVSEIQCDVCRKIFANNQLLEHHRNNKQKYLCDICNDGFCKVSDLAKHRKVMHAHETYSCTICVKSFNGCESLRRHMTNAHYGKYICDTCGIKCGSNNKLEEHVRTHTGERPFKCEVCGKGFAQQSTLGTHIRCTHNTEKPYVCELCGKGFSILSSLRLHKAVHIENSEKKFVCSVCNKAFRTNNGLRKHSVRHGIKNHNCAVCCKEFFDSTSLIKHMRTHTGERPFECHTCQKRFSQKYNLQIHFKSHRSKTKISK